MLVETHIACVCSATNSLGSVTAQFRIAHAQTQARQQVGMTSILLWKLKFPAFSLIIVTLRVVGRPQNAVVATPTFVKGRNLITGVRCTLRQSRCCDGDDGDDDDVQPDVAVVPAVEVVPVAHAVQPEAAAPVLPLLESTGVP